MSRFKIRIAGKTTGSTFEAPEMRTTLKLENVRNSDHWAWQALSFLDFEKKIRALLSERIVILNLAPWW